MNERKVFFMEWTSNNTRFIKDVSISSSLTRFVTVHIFYPQDISSSRLPKYKPWLFKHPVSKNAGDEVFKAMELYMLRYKFRIESSDKLMERRQLTKAFIVSREQDERTRKLVDTVAVETPGVQLEVIDNKCVNLIDLMDFKCNICKMAFKEHSEVAKHDGDVHSHVCYNMDCIHSNKERCFTSEKELQRHLSCQMRCIFCPGRVFCVKDLLQAHMRETHKKCPCPCGKYFGNRQAYLDHFFSRYPSPKSIMSRYKIENSSSQKNKKLSNRSVKMQQKSVSDDEAINNQALIGRPQSPLDVPSESSFQDDETVTDNSINSIEHIH